MAPSKTLVDIVEGLAHEPFLNGFGSLEVTWQTLDGSACCHQAWPPRHCPFGREVARRGIARRGRIDELAGAELCPVCFEGEGLFAFLATRRVKGLVEFQRARDALVSSLAKSPEVSYPSYNRLKDARRRVQTQWGPAGRWNAGFVADFLMTADGPLEEARRRFGQLRDQLTGEFANAQHLAMDALDTTPTLVGFADAKLGFGPRNPLCMRAVEVYRVARDGNGLVLVAPRFVVDHLLAKLAMHRPLDFTTVALQAAGGGEIGADVIEVAASLWDPHGAIASMKVAFEMGEAAVWGEVASRGAPPP